ncbi:MAG: DUF4830 domain-containing protein [Oscillospiraceae bacterium]|nr:DUF4830 domain-containing protein [Oscillospiraceae bacterium]
MKKTAVYILVFIVLAAGILFAADIVNKKKEISVVTPDDVSAYLMRYGWETDKEAIKSEDIIIPHCFDELYQKYNEMMLRQGFDLSRYKGHKAKLITCPVTNYGTDDDVYADIILIDTKLVGASLKCPGDEEPIKPLNKH